MNDKNAFSTLLTVLITAVIVGVLTGVITYSYAASKKDLEIEDLKEQLSQAEPRASVAPKTIVIDQERVIKEITETSIDIDDTGNYKIATNKIMGLRFKYPKDWADLTIEKSYKPVLKEPATAADNFYTGTSYTSLTSFDPDNIFSIALHSKDHDFYVFEAFNKKPINVNWTKEEFIKNMNIKELDVYTKKLSNKSMLVVSFDGYECSPFIYIDVMTPFNEEFPNLEIKIHKNFDEDLTVKDYEEKNKDAVCDFTPYKEIVQKIYKGTYSEKINSYIKTAQAIADSVEIIK